jgi:uncharacterized membrane protein
MVKVLAPLEQAVVTKALRQAEANTGASIGLVITPTSDTYLGYVLLDTFLIAGLINGGLFLSHLILNTDYLMLIQFAAMFMAFIPIYRRCIVTLMPRAIRHHHAARSAVMTFHNFLNEAPTNKDVVLLYVSLTERYVHVFQSRSLKDKVNSTYWQDIIAQFTKVMPTLGLYEATLQAIKNIENVLNA